MKNIKKYVRIILDKFYFPFLLRGAIRKLASLRREAATPEAAFDLAEGFRFGPDIRELYIQIKPAQIKEEITGLINDLPRGEIKAILEIGTATGGTLFLWSQLFPAADIISIDLPFGRYGAGFLPTKARFLKSFARGEQRVELICGDSHSQKVKDRLREVLAGQKLDLLFIDGDHTYEGVKKDFDGYRGLVRPGGYVAFHDIAGYQPGREIGEGWKEHYPTREEYTSVQVCRFWQELKRDYPGHWEYLAEGPSQAVAGIGLIRIA